MAELNYLDQVPLGGFNYDNCLRNTALETQTNMAHKSSYTKTGTTICGVIFQVSSPSLATPKVSLTHLLFVRFSGWSGHRR